MALNPAQGFNQNRPAEVVILGDIMKKLLQILGVMLFTTFPLYAQTFVQSVSQQVTDPKTTYALAFSKPNTAPCTLIMSARAFSLPAFTDANGNAWVKAPGHNGLWYTTSCASGINTVTIPFTQPSYFQAVISEYSGVLVPDQISNLQTGITLLATSPFVTAQSGDLIIGSGWNESSNFDIVTPGSGFVMRGDVNVYLEDSIQPSTGPAISTATYAFVDPIGWHAAVAAFQVSVPPPPPPAKINLSVTGSILFDDQTALPVTASLNVQQSDNKGGLVNAGSVAMDSAGNLSGTLYCRSGISQFCWFRYFPVFH